MAKEKKPKSKTRKILEWVGTGIFAALIVFAAVVLFTTKIQRKNSNNPNAPARFGDLYFPVIVLTDSMDPVYPVDSAIFIKSVSPEYVYQSYLDGNKLDITFDDFYKPGQDITYTQEEKDFLSTYKCEPDDPTCPSKTDRTTRNSPMRTMTHRIFYVYDTGNELGNGKYHFFVEGINHNGNKSARNQYQVFTEKEMYGQVTGCSKFVGGIFKFAESPWGLVILLIIPSLYMVLSSVIDVIRAYKEDDGVQETTPKATSGDPLAGISEKEKEKLKQQMLEEIMKGKDKK